MLPTLTLGMSPRKSGWQVAFLPNYPQKTHPLLQRGKAWAWLVPFPFVHITNSLSQLSAPSLLTSSLLLAYSKPSVEMLNQQLLESDEDVFIN